MNKKSKCDVNIMKGILNWTVVKTEGGRPRALAVKG